MAVSAGVDATVVAIPFYFASMEAERRWLVRRAETEGPSAADYERPDTIASLTMGVASLVVPLASHALVRHVTPGRGRFGKALVGTAIGAAVATTVADRILARAPARTTPPHANPWTKCDANDTRRPPVAEVGPVGPVGPVDGGPAAATDGSVVHAGSEGDGNRRLRRWAGRVARVGGPVAVGTGALALASAVSDRTSATRMWRKGRRRDLGNGPLAWAVAVAGWDFIYYWNHRFMHEVRGMWAIHVVHHSSERYNLSTALRQPVADALGVWVPYGVLSRVGVRPSLVQQARGINLLYQYWIHTDAIRKLGPAEEVLNTPSHHRVHHGRNTKYIDRNHGSILILWDRLFGTFQREEEPVVYGLTKNIETYSPVRIATHEYRDIVRDIAGSTTWKDRLSYVLRGPGWAYARHAERSAGGIS